MMSCSLMPSNSVAMRAIELAYALGAAARRHVERHHIDLVGQVFLHRRSNCANIGIEPAADLVRNDESDVALGKPCRIGGSKGGPQGAGRDGKAHERVHDQGRCSTRHDALTQREMTRISITSAEGGARAVFEVNFRQAVVTLPARKC